MTSGEKAGSKTVIVWPKLLGWLFGGEGVREEVATRVYFGATPEAAWNEIIFYEEAPGRAPFPLRTFMPCPVRTDGAKASVGARVRCVYDRGYLIKRITMVAAPCLIRFEVTEQHLGIEGCVVALGGSYEIEPSGEGSEFLLTTRYMAYLHPRSLWRPLEQLVAGQLHKHVLKGMGAAMSQSPEAVACVERLH
jgi:hypothetical protein